MDFVPFSREREDVYKDTQRNAGYVTHDHAQEKGGVLSVAFQTTQFHNDGFYAPDQEEAEGVVLHFDHSTDCESDGVDGETREAISKVVESDGENTTDAHKCEAIPVGGLHNLSLAR